MTKEPESIRGFHNIVGAMIDKRIDSAYGTRRFLAEFELVFGGPIRSLVYSHPATARSVVSGMRDCVSEIERHCRGVDSGALYEAARFAFGTKCERILEREVRIFGSILERESVPLQTMLVEARVVEPSLKDTVLIAHLARLIAGGFVKRSRKGVYARSDTSEQYYVYLRAETGRRRERHA
jgi:hypothetical protein